MTGLQVDEAILQHWKTGWEGLHPTNQADPNHVPWTTRNESFELGALGALGAWVRIVVVSTTSEQVTHGSKPNRKFERRGYVFVQVFAAVNHVSGVNVLDGNATVKALVDDVVAVLEGNRVSGVNLYAANPVPLPEKDGWNGYAITIPYRVTQMR